MTPPEALRCELWVSGRGLARRRAHERTKFHPDDASRVRATRRRGATAPWHLVADVDGSRPHCRRSIIAIGRVLDEFFVDPAASVVPAPNLTANKPAGNRSSWNDDSPKMPDFRPCGLRRHAQGLKNMVALRSHFRRRASPARSASDSGGRSIAARRCSSSWTCWRSRCTS